MLRWSGGLSTGSRTVCVGTSDADAAGRPHHRINHTTTRGGPRCALRLFTSAYKMYKLYPNNSGGKKAAVGRCRARWMAAAAPPPRLPRFVSALNGAPTPGHRLTSVRLTATAGGARADQGRSLLQVPVSLGDSSNPTADPAQNLYCARDLDDRQRLDLVTDSTTLESPRMLAQVWKTLLLRVTS